MLGITGELRAVRIAPAQHVPGILDHHDLHPEADPEAGQSLEAGERRGLDHALDPALAEPAGNQDAVEALEAVQQHRLFGQSIRIDLDEVDLAEIGDAPMVQGLVDGLVGVQQFRVLADQADPDAPRGAVVGFHDFAPLAEIARPGRQVQLAENDGVELLLGEMKGDFVHGGGHVVGRNHRFVLHVGEQGDLAAQHFRDRHRSAAQQDIRLNAALLQGLDRVLGRLGLELPVGNRGHQGQVDEQNPALAQVVDELTGRLQERNRLDVPDRAADLDDRHVHPRLLPDPENSGLDLVGDVGNDLNRSSQEVTLAFLANDLLIHLPGGYGVGAAERRGGEALVIAQIEVRLGSVIGHEDLAVLVGTHRPRIDVDVRINFEHPHRKPVMLQQTPDRRGSHTFAEAGAHSAGDKDILAHTPLHYSQAAAGCQFEGVASVVQEPRPELRPGVRLAPEAGGPPAGEVLLPGAWRNRSAREGSSRQSIRAAVSAPARSSSQA